MSSIVDKGTRSHRILLGLPKLVIPVLLGIALISCARKPESETSTTTETQKVQVNRIDLGRTIGTDRRITTITESFAPRDTVYASVILAAPAPAGQVTARWTSADGTIVSESTQMVSPSQIETMTDFYIAKPEGLAPGTYKLEILVDGEVTSTKQFIVTGS
jgi:hypothetical protein